MRFTTEGPAALQVAGLAVLLLVSGFVVMHLVGRPGDRPAPAGATAAPAPPPGADDPSNPGVFVEGGTFLRGSDHPGESDDPASPFHTGDEDPVRRVGGGSFAEGPFFLRASNRNNGFFEGHANSGVGFRVVWPAEGG